MGRDGARCQAGAPAPPSGTPAPRVGLSLPPHSGGSSLAARIIPKSQFGHGERGDTHPPTLRGCSPPRLTRADPPQHRPVPTHLRGRLGPPDPAHARHSPLPARAGPVAPAPGAGHSCTQLGGGGSRRAPHWFPALALNAGTCSPAMAEPRWSWIAQSMQRLIFLPQPVPFIPTRLFAGQEHPQGQQLEPSSEWARKGPRSHPTLGQGESIT